MVSEAARDRQVARETVRRRDECHHCEPGAVPDSVLYALNAHQRRVVRGMARGGWASGSPGIDAVTKTASMLGLSNGWWSEQVRGEPRAYMPTGIATVLWQALAARLDALPRRDLGRRRTPPRPR